jgi:hypothetical protein
MIISVSVSIVITVFFRGLNHNSRLLVLPNSGALLFRLDGLVRLRETRQMLHWRAASSL